MRTVSIIALMAALTTPVYAQANFGNHERPGAKAEQQKAEEAKQRALEDKAYRNSLSRIPERERDKKPDPWGNLR